MPRPVTLFTGQWADMPIEELAAKAGEWGFDGLELACWGDHFDVAEALRDPAYARGRRELLERHGLNCWALGAHLVGQAICDPIDARHEASCRPRSGATASPRACGRARRRAWPIRPEPLPRSASRRSTASAGRASGTSSTRSRRTTSRRSRPVTATSPSASARSSTRSTPRACGFGLEVHPTEIAYDFVTTRKALAAVGRREAFGINMDPSHFAHQFLDPAAFVDEFAGRIYHVHVKDSRMALDGRRSILGSHLDFGSVERGWDFVSPGRGDVDFEAFIRALNRAGDAGPLSIEWEDAGMDREYGARDALAFTRRLDFTPSSVAFDAAFAGPDA